MSQTLVIGDLHINSKNYVKLFENQILPLLKRQLNDLKTKPNIEQVVLLGDFSEYWKEPNNSLPVYKVLIEILQTLTDSLPNLKQIVLIEGNHDIHGSKSLLNQEFTDILGMIFKQVKIKVLPAITGNQDLNELDINQYIDVENKSLYLPYVSKSEVFKELLNKVADSNIRFVYSHNNFYELYPELPEVYKSEFPKFKNYFGNDTVLISGHIHKPNFDSLNKLYIVGSIHFQNFNEADSLPILFVIVDNQTGEITEVVFNTASEVFVIIETDNDIVNKLEVLLKQGVNKVNVRVKTFAQKQLVEQLLTKYKVQIGKLEIKPDTKLTQFVPLDIADIITNDNLNQSIEELVKQLAVNEQFDSKQNSYKNEPDSSMLYDLIAQLEQAIVVDDIVNIANRVIAELFK